MTTNELGQAVVSGDQRGIVLLSDAHVESVKASWRTRLLRLGVRVLAATLLAGPLMIEATSEATAEPYATGGTVAAYSIPTARCDFKTWGNSTVLVSKAGAPTVYAPDYRAGGDNDAAYVRYQVYLVDTVTNTTTANSDWSGWGYATDVTPTTWSGPATTLSHAATGENPHRVIYKIEWYHSSTMTGWLADRVTSYDYYDRYGQGPLTATSC